MTENGRAPSIGMRAGDKIFAYLMLAPSVLLLLALSTLPVGMALWNSFRDVNTLTREGPWVGLAKYKSLLADHLFWDALWRTGIWTFSGVVIQLVLGLAFSIVLHRNLYGRWIARGLVLVPYLIPTIVTALVWRAMLNADTGVVNFILLDVLGVIDRPVAWLAEPDKAMIALIGVGAWKYTPFMVILFLARLQTAPLSLYEAARMDGARPWQEFLYVTIPWLAPTILVAMLLRTLFLFNDFDMVYLLAYGGPRMATTTLPVLIHAEAFAFRNLGAASAISALMLLELVPFTLVYLRLYAHSESRISG